MELRICARNLRTRICKTPSLFGSITPRTLSKEYVATAIFRASFSPCLTCYKQEQLFVGRSLMDQGRPNAQARTSFMNCSEVTSTTSLFPLT
jgi:hypothetical protein